MVHGSFDRCGSRADPIFGTMVTFDALDAVELHSQLGPDYLVIDCQHTLIAEHSAQRLIYAAQTPGTAVMVRVSSGDPTLIGKIADAGADAVIIPMINNAEEAAAAVAACCFGSRGVRSLGPVRRFLSPDPGVLEERIACFVMIETAQAMDNLDAICATPGLAGVYLGSADLSLSLGEKLFVLPSPPFLREAGQRIVAACRKAGVIPGAHAGPMERTRELIDDGFQLLTLGLDWLYIMRGAREDIAAAKAYLAERRD